MSLQAREQRCFLQTYNRLAIEIDRAEGMWVYTAEGDRYLDFLGGIAALATGHSHPRIREAIDHQLDRYAHVSNFFYQDAQIEFGERLAAMSEFDRVFLCNSGTEGVEAAIKLARAWGSQRSRTRTFAFTGGFHGRSYAALSHMAQEKYRRGMGPFLPDAEVLPYNDPDALDSALGEDTCAVMLEFLQGEGGVVEASEEFVERIFELRERYGFLVIADEVQAGAGRTGTFNSFDRFGVRPDVAVMAKAIGAGLPLGALLATEEVGDAWSSGQHGTTFGGNAVSCAAGSAFLDLLDAGLIDHVAASGEYLGQSLQKLRENHPKLICDVRGRGAIQGVEFTCEARPIVDRLLEERVIANATSTNVLRLVPPYIFEHEHVDLLVEVLDHALALQSTR